MRAAAAPAGDGAAGAQRPGGRLAMGGLKEELLKAIWHAFTALDLDQSDKVSKSQLKAHAGGSLGVSAGLGGKCPPPHPGAVPLPACSGRAAVGEGSRAWGNSRGFAGSRLRASRL